MSVDASLSQGNSGGATRAVPHLSLGLLGTLSYGSLSGLVCLFHYTPMVFFTSVISCSIYKNSTFSLTCISCKAKVTLCDSEPWLLKLTHFGRGNLS